MTEGLGVVIVRFWAVAGSSCLEIRSCTVSLTTFYCNVEKDLTPLNQKKLYESC